MKRVFIALCFPVFAFAQQNGISGSVFFKYNELIGNRPDAGAPVRLYPLNNPGGKVMATVELSGDFSITNIDTGQHLIIIKSKETNANPYITYSTLIIYSRIIDKYFNVDLKEINPALRKEIEVKHDAYLEYLTSGKAKDKKISSMRMEITDLVFKFFSEIPVEKLIAMGLSLPTENIYIEEIKIPANKKVIVDFGITYM